MPYCKPVVSAILAPGLLLTFICSTTAFSASKPDSPSSEALAPNAKEFTLALDTSRMVEKPGNGSDPPGSAGKTTASEKDKSTRNNNLGTDWIYGDTSRVNARELFGELGVFHRAMGIYAAAAGALAVIVGSAVLDRQDILPYSLSLITFGGITAGIGIWEIRVGIALSKLQPSPGRNKRQIAK